MRTTSYTIDLNKDPKGMIRFVRDDLKRIISSPGAINIEGAKRKIRFYEWCLGRMDGVERFSIYLRRKQFYGEEAGFRAAGWEE